MKAVSCGFKKNDNIRVNYGKNNERKNKRWQQIFNTVIKDALDEYTLKIMTFDPDKDVVDEKKTIIGRKCKKIQQSKTIYIFDNGKHHYDPLLKNESTFLKHTKAQTTESSRKD